MSEHHLASPLDSLVERYRIETEQMADGRWRARIRREICVEEFAGSLEDAVQASLLAYLGLMSHFPRAVA